MAIDRGNTVFFKNISFADKDGNAIVATSATLSLLYPSKTSATPEKADVTLALTGNGTWEGSWDSSVAAEGTVFGYLKGTDGQIVCVKDFKFRLVANDANKNVNNG